MRSKIVKRKRLRKEAFVYSHPRTFCYRLWRQICDADLRGEDGLYLKAGWDVPMMMAMLEMSGTRFRYISAILYVYNDTNPISDANVRSDLQEQVERIARAREPYPTLDVAQR